VVGALRTAPAAGLEEAEFEGHGSRVAADVAVAVAGSEKAGCQGAGTVSVKGVAIAGSEEVGFQATGTGSVEAVAVALEKSRVALAATAAVEGARFVATAAATGEAELAVAEAGVVVVGAAAGYYVGFADIVLAAQTTIAVSVGALIAVGVQTAAEAQAAVEVHAPIVAEAGVVEGDTAGRAPVSVEEAMSKVRAAEESMA